MKNKKNIIFMITFIVFVTIVGLYFYTKNVDAKTTFKNLSHDRYEVEMLKNPDMSFDELKLQLKGEYSNKFLSIFDDIKQNFDTFLNETLGTEFCSLKTEIEELNKQIFEHRKTFSNSGEYQKCKADLKRIKAELDAETDENKIVDLQNELKATLSEISTLNVKLENQLKDVKDQIKQKRLKANEISAAKKDEITAKLNELTISTKSKIDQIVESYNVELKELCELYGEKYVKRELPIDLRLIKTPLPQFDKNGKLYHLDDENVFSVNDTTYIN